MAWVALGIIVDEQAAWVTWIIRCLFVGLLATWFAGWLVLRQRKVRGAP